MKTSWWKSVSTPSPSPLSIRFWWKSPSRATRRSNSRSCGIRTTHAITICGMENIDPVGVHTGDSMVVAPIMTLSDHDMKMLNDSAIKIIRALKVEGGCNVQFALDPNSSKYYLIEVNPRVSRSSALASKATGYPIARVTAKIAVGMALEDIKIANTNAAFEPKLDYVVTKLPRFPFDKFTSAINILGTQMMATGEVMGIGSNLEESLLKGIRSLEVGANHIYHHKFDDMTTEELLDYISVFRSDNIFAIAEMVYRGVTVEQIHEITAIDVLFPERHQADCGHGGIPEAPYQRAGSPSGRQEDGLQRQICKPAVEML